MSGSYAKKGEVLTCENGHEICEFSHDVKQHDTVYYTDFVDFRNGNTIPYPGDIIGAVTCILCNARYIRANSLRNISCYINGEWRFG